MKRLFGSRLITGILAVFLFGTPLFAGAADSESSPDTDWGVGVDLYLWAPWIDVKTETGGDVEISLNDILTNLDMMFMGVVHVDKGKWSFVTDMIYFDIESDENADLPLDLALDEFDLQAWVVTPEVRYTVWQTNKHKVGLVAGARYLWIEGQLKLNTRPPLPPGSRKAKDSASVWDGIVGATGQIELSDKWYLASYADIGTGDSDLTWQAVAMFGYQFKRMDAAVGYRYLDYEFDSSDPIADLTIHGPFAGIRYMF
jgi:hypothetical protein